MPTVNEALGLPKARESAVDLALSGKKKKLTALDDVSKPLPGIPYSENEVFDNASATNHTLTSLPLIVKEQEDEKPFNNVINQGPKHVISEYNRLVAQIPNTRTWQDDLDKKPELKRKLDIYYKALGHFAGAMFDSNESTMRYWPTSPATVEAVMGYPNDKK